MLRRKSKSGGDASSAVAVMKLPEWCENNAIVIHKPVDSVHALPNPVSSNASMHPTAVTAFLMAGQYVSSVLESKNVKAALGGGEVLAVLRNCPISCDIIEVRSILFIIELTRDLTERNTH
jgi:hypothetical protein